MPRTCGRTRRPRLPSLIGLVLIEITGVEELDAIVALLVGSAIVYAGVRILTRSSRVLMDEALPPDELDIVREQVANFPAPELVGYHKLRGRRAGSARHIDLHLQFAPGTSLERAHAIAHGLQASVREKIPQADLLVHTEPSRRRMRRADGLIEETPRGDSEPKSPTKHPQRACSLEAQGSRLTAAARPTNARTAL